MFLLPYLLHCTEKKLHGIDVDVWVNMLYLQLWVSQPQWGNAAPCSGKPRLRVSFAQKAVTWRHDDWCIRKPTTPYFEAHSFRWFSSILKPALVCVWWQSLCSERWHFDSVSKISWQPCGCTYRMYSHLFVWGEMKHAAGDYIQTISFYIVPCSIAPLKAYSWQNSPDPICRALIWGVPTTTWSIALRLELAKCHFCLEHGHRFGNSWLACFRSPALSRKSFTSLLCAGNETFWQLI